MHECCQVEVVTDLLYAGGGGYSAVPSGAGFHTAWSGVNKMLVGKGLVAIRSSPRYAPVHVVSMQHMPTGTPHAGSHLHCLQLFDGKRVFALLS